MVLERTSQHRAQVEEFRRKHRTGLVTLLFTDIVGSAALDSSAWCSGELLPGVERRSGAAVRLHRFSVSFSRGR